MWKLVYVIFVFANNGKAVAVSNGEIDEIQNHAQCVATARVLQAKIEETNKGKTSNADGLAARVNVASHCMLGG